MNGEERVLWVLDDDGTDVKNVHPSSHGYAQPLAGVPDPKELERKIPIGFVQPKPPRKPARRK